MLHMRGTVLVADDQPRARQALANELRDAGFDVCEADSGTEAWERFRGRRPDVVITDLVMPRSDGLDLLSRIREVSEVPVILFTAHGTPQAAAAAFKGGADEFICSPDVEIDELVGLVANAVSRTGATPAHPDLESRLVGESRAISRTRERLSGLAPLRTPVLIAGEAGSGRDTAARALHELGSSAGDELVRVDPRAPRLATNRAIPAAVYIDGIEALDAEGQAYWQKLIDEREQEAFRPRPRILASTSLPLATLGADERFARGVGRILLRFALELPPLADRAADVPQIAAALVERIGRSVGRQVRLSPAARAYLAEQRWPGNLVQLERVLERAVTYSRARQIRRETVADVFEELSESLDAIRQRGSLRERQELLHALEVSRGNISRTAEMLDRSRAAVYRLIEKHGIPLNRAS
jgi:DNA-binding NtrC family response regulator